MKQLTEPETSTAPNAWGRDIKCTRQQFEIEQADVGTTKPHFGGYNYATLTFAQRDVGKTIEVMHYEGYTCFGFVN